MRIDWSSGTSPRSRSSTMRSSASSACSKLMALMSALAISSAIDLTPHQAADMSADGKRQPLQVVPALQQADEAALRPPVRLVHQFARSPVEIVLGQVDLGERVTVMRIESGRYDD